MKILLDIKAIHNKDHIYIYGAGMYAVHVYEYLYQNKFLNIDGFIVSCEENIENRNLSGCPVYALNEIEYLPNTCGVILALSEKYHNDVLTLLDKKGFVNVSSFSEKELKEIEHKNNLFSLEIMHKYMIENIVKKHNTKTQYKNFLIVRMDGIGDMVLTTPFIRELRRNHPCANITLVTSSTSMELFYACPYLDEVLSYDCQKTMKLPLKRKLESLREFARENLRLGEYDCAIVPRWDTDWYGASFLTFLSGATHRVAYSEKVDTDKAYYNQNYDSMFTDLIVDRILKHEVERNMNVLLEIGDIVCDTRLELWETNSDRCRIKQSLKKFLHDGYRLIAFGISASIENKKWNINNYLQLINLLHGKNLKFVLVGGIEDEESSEMVFSNCDVLNLVGKLSLREIVALMRNVLLYVGNDTGVMHIAAACGVKILEIRGEDHVINSIKRFHPWGVEYVILQSKNTNQQVDINSVSVADVMKKIDFLLRDFHPSDEIQR